MMLLLILFITLLYLILNYYLSGRDIANPSVLFCATHLASITACVLWGQDYGATFHVETLLVIILGLSAFTIVNIIFISYKQKKYLHRPKVELELYYISVKRSVLIVIIAIQLIILIFSLRYVVSVSRAFYGGGKTIFRYIGLYRLFNIHHSSKLSSLGISRPLPARFGKVVASILCYPLMAIEANNFLVRRKPDLLICISIAINIVFSFITGTRSEAFRIMCAIAYFVIVLYKLKKGGRSGFGLKSILKVVFLIIIAGYGFLAIRDLIGRSVAEVSKWYYSVIPYFGGPFMNLDKALQSSLPSTSIWGQYTFKEIINKFFTGILNISAYDNSAIYTFNRFNGLNTGNVYTTYYPFIIDFGYWGVFPLTFLIGLYYCWSYNKDMNPYRNSSPLGTRFFFSGYMFNSLIMLVFSNRFYEHIVSTYVFTFIIGMSLYWRVLSRRYITYIPIV